MKNTRLNVDTSVMETQHVCAGLLKRLLAWHIQQTPLHNTEYMQCIDT